VNYFSYIYTMADFSVHTDKTILSISDIDTNTEEGKMLIAAIAHIIRNYTKKRDQKEVLKRIIEVRNKLYGTTWTDSDSGQFEAIVTIDEEISTHTNSHVGKVIATHE